MRGSSRPGSIISSHLLPTHLEINVEANRGQIFAASPIALQSRFKRVPNEPILTYGHCCPQRQSVCLKSETNRAGRHCKTAIGGRYATRRVVLMPGAELFATGVSLTALTERIHSDGAIPSGRSHSPWTEMIFADEGLLQRPNSPQSGCLPEFPVTFEARNLWDPKTAAMECILIQ